MKLSATEQEEFKDLIQQPGFPIVARLLDHLAKLQAADVMRRALDTEGDAIRLAFSRCRAEGARKLVVAYEAYVKTSRAAEANKKAASGR